MTPKKTVSSRARSRGGEILIGSRRFDVKAHARGLRELYRWLDQSHFGVIVAADRAEPLVVLRLGDFLRQCAFREPAQEGRSKPSNSVSGASTASGPA